VKTFYQSGGTVSWTVSGGTVTVGTAVLLGTMLGIVTALGPLGGINTDVVAVQVEGVEEITKVTADDMTTIGTKLFWDNSTKKLTLTSNSGANSWVATVGESAGTSATQVKAKLNGFGA
jgi:predicted RecA/RadA family phage recombinase